MTQHSRGGTLIGWVAARLPHLRAALLDLEREETEFFSGQDVGPTYYLRTAFMEVILPYVAEHFNREDARHLLKPVFDVIEEMAIDGRPEFYEVLLTTVVTGIGGDTAKGRAIAKSMYGPETAEIARVAES